MPPAVSKLKGEEMFSVTLYILERLLAILLPLALFIFPKALTVM
jgi:hypothetical protein